MDKLRNNGSMDSATTLPESFCVEQLDQLRAAARQAMFNQFRFRREWANMLHDRLQQLLVGARLIAQPNRSGNPESCRADKLTELDGILKQCLQSVRELSVELSPPSAEDGDLAEALCWLLAHLGRDEADLMVEGQIPSLQPDLCALLLSCTSQWLGQPSLKDNEIQLILRRKTGWLEIIATSRNRAAGRLVSQTDVAGIHSIRNDMMSVSGLVELSFNNNHAVTLTLSYPLKETSDA
jgi:signal transduction histidine kinase